MGRALFVLSIGFNAAVYSFVCVAVFATLLMQPSEESVGWGLLWALSLPAFFFYSLASLLVYPRYLSGSTRTRVAIYVAAVSFVAATSLATSYALFEMPF